MQEVRVQKKRVISYDVTRALAILLVILCHATELAYTTYFKQPEIISWPVKIIVSSLFALGRLGVPLFLFLTGALVLRKQIESDSDVIQFYKKNLLPLFLVNLVWVIIYNLFFMISGKAEYINPINVLEEFLLLRPVPLMNMWYMPMIIGMYIALPFIAKIVKVFSEKSLFVGMLVVFITSSIIPFINFLLDIRGFEPQHRLIPAINISFLGGLYGLYILIGFFIRRERKLRIKSSALIIAAIASFISSWGWQTFTKCNGSEAKYNIWYDCPFILICCVCLFILINRVDFSKINKKIVSAVTFLSKISLGMFFVHIIIQESLTNAISALSLSQVAKLQILLWGGVCGSIVACYFIKKSKFGSKYLLLVKKT